MTVRGCHGHQHQPARNRTPGIDQRQGNQRDRIQNGIESGQLTRQEARELRQSGAEIRELEKEAKADGVVTREEREQIRQALRERSGDIYEAKHDGQQRNPFV